MRKTEIAMVDCIERDIKEREKNRDKEQQREGPGDCWLTENVMTAK